MANYFFGGGNYRLNRAIYIFHFIVFCFPSNSFKSRKCKLHFDWCMFFSVTVSCPVEGGTQRGRLFLIDLAGSERAGLRARRLEGAHINRSLLALGNCIMALSGGARWEYAIS